MSIYLNMKIELYHKIDDFIGIETKWEPKTVCGGAPTHV